MLYIGSSIYYLLFFSKLRCLDVDINRMPSLLNGPIEASDLQSSISFCVAVYTTRDH